MLLSAGPVMAEATLNTLVNFDRTSNGANPLGALIADSAGNLYGTSNTGGLDGDGTVFVINAKNHTLTTLATFSGGNGANPAAGLVLDSAGDLYGTTSSGGSGGQGTVFDFNIKNNSFSTPASFNFTNGASPEANLLLDSEGNLYGTTNGGGANYQGTVFKVAAGTHTLSTPVTFNNTNGSYPTGGLFMDGMGNVFGTTSQGGASSDGTVFEIVAGSNTVNPLVTFNGTNGSGPACTLIADAAGNLYGTTGYGGANSDGTIFKIAAGTGDLTTLATFDGSQGEYPSAGLIADAAGNLYGTAFYGGSGGEGTVFELAAGSSTITTLAEFDGDNGAFPMTSLIADSSGNLYGTTFEGGTNGVGTVFELTNTGFVVPEPGALALLAVAGLFLRRVR
ncbi:MAG TPA: choice-of-anchor tandem repeat GloVer-containing protein [Tepidisphaeraceae bacterium]